jgi:hypothetical protein
LEVIVDLDKSNYGGGWAKMTWLKSIQESEKRKINYGLKSFKASPFKGYSLPDFFVVRFAISKL